VTVARRKERYASWETVRLLAKLMQHDRFTGGSMVAEGGGWEAMLPETVHGEGDASTRRYGLIQALRSREENARLLNAPNHRDTGICRDRREASDGSCRFRLLEPTALPGA